jgi:TrpR-related protein YerC/YecD
MIVFVQKLMGKYDAKKRLTKDQQQDLFINFAKALAAIKSPVEAANFIKDLLSEGEVVMLARRLQIAQLLLADLTYDDIKREMKVSNTTIARVHTWLNLYGEGYRVIAGRIKERPNKTDDGPLSWNKVKKKYPMYYWPELVLDEIIRNANVKQRRKLTAVLDQMDEKTKLSKELTRLLKMDRSYHAQ